MSENTLNNLFDLAIRAENIAEEAYTRLAGMFCNYPDVAEFWQRYAAEEKGHAAWLNSLRARLAPEKLAEPVDAAILGNARRVTGVSVEEALAQIHNLDEAYQLASDMESGETNTVFGFLIDNFADDPQTHTFLRTQLRSHMARLAIDLPTQYRGKANRQKILCAPVP